MRQIHQLAIYIIFNISSPYQTSRGRPTIGMLPYIYMYVTNMVTTPQKGGNTPPLMFG
jgi:hypothetical protein